MKAGYIFFALVFFSRLLLLSQEESETTYCSMLWYAGVTSVILFDVSKSEQAIFVEYGSNWLITFKLIRYYKNGQWYSSGEKVTVGMRELYSQLGIKFENVDHTPDYFLVFLDEDCREPISVFKAPRYILEAMEVEVDGEAEGN